jgi:hypothetical protein
VGSTINQQENQLAKCSYQRCERKHWGLKAVFAGNADDAQPNSSAPREGEMTPPCEEAIVATKFVDGRPALW